MSSATKILLGLIAILVFGAIIMVLSFIGSYNGLVAMRQATDAQWAQVENVYQRRADLVPNLVATVKGSANFEQSTLEAVTNARASVGRVQLPGGGAPTDPAQLQAFQQAQNALGSSLSRLLVVAENYPNLKASQSFIDLQAQLEGTENRIAVERGRFNDVVQLYNTAVQRFPGMIVAGFGHFVPRPYFAAAAGAETPPKVQFDFGTPTPAPAKP